MLPEAELIEDLLPKESIPICRRPASRWLARALAALILATAALVLVSPAQAQPPPEPPPQEEQTTTEEISDPDLEELLGETICAPGECCPPTTQEWVMIGVGFVAIFLLCFFLLRPLMERRFINQEKNALLGRHLGVSLTLVLSAAGLAGLTYLITDCLHREPLIWLGIAGAIWLIHLIYTLVVVRAES